VVRIPLRESHKEIGALEAGSYGAFVSGETYAALEFLAEQLPAAIDNCRLIEEKLKLERQLAERERLALVGQMAASISHNLRNPLSSMKTVLQVLPENRELPESVREDCELVVGEIDRLATKLNQLLHYAKASVRATSGKERVDVTAVIEQVVALLRRDAERRRVTLRFERPAEPVNALGSEEGMSDVASNLIVNAIEALPNGGNICVSLGPRDSRVNLEVTDDGPGISAQLQAQLFRPFFTTKPSGTGLGLAIVEKRLLEMDGSIICESPIRDGKGTRFIVTLPLAE
jgi:signal transduction histidine kinase